MDSKHVVSSLVVLLVVLGAFVSFAATGSQAQFAALNAFFLSLAGAAAAAGMLTASLRAEATHLPSKTAFAGFAFLLWALLSSATSGRFASAFMGEPTSNVGVLSLLALGLVGAYAAKERERVVGLVRWVAPALIVLQGVPALLEETNPVDRGHGGFSNSSALGFALAVLLPFVLSMPSSGRPVWERYARYGVAGFAVVTALLIEARIAAGLMIACVAWFVLSDLKISHTTKRTAWLGSASVGVLAAAALIYLERAGRLPFGFLTIRYELWSTAMRALRQRAFAGYGADGFFSAGASVTDFNPASATPPLVFIDGTTDPHNALVWIAVSFGLAGLALALLCIVMWGRRMAEQKPLDRFSPAFISVCVGGVLLLTIPASLDILPLFALLAGLSFEPINPAERRPSRFARVALVVSFALAGVVAVVGCVDLAARVAVGPVSYLAPPPLARSQRFVGAFGWDPYFVHLLNSSFGNSAIEGGASKSVISDWSGAQPVRAIQADELNPYYALAYAQAVWNSGRPTREVVAAFAEAIRRYPSFPSAHAELALLLAQAGDAAGARQEIAKVQTFGDPQAYPWGKAIGLAEQTLATQQ